MPAKLGGGLPRSPIAHSRLPAFPVLRGSPEASPTAGARAAFAAPAAGRLSLRLLTSGARVSVAATAVKNIDWSMAAVSETGADIPRSGAQAAEAVALSPVASWARRIPAERAPTALAALRLGCCPRCALRMARVADPRAYRGWAPSGMVLLSALNGSGGDADDSPHSSASAEPYCPACLGALQGVHAPASDAAAALAVGAGLPLPEGVKGEGAFSLSAGCAVAESGGMAKMTWHLAGGGGAAAIAAEVRRSGYEFEGRDFWRG